MSFTALFLAVTPLAAAPAPVAGDLVAIKARRVETASQGTLEHAVILVDKGKIVMVGEDLPIERGIPVVEVPDDWVVMPGLVNAYSRAGMDSAGSSAAEPQIRASQELYPHQSIYSDLLELGVTTLGLYPAGNGIPGQACAIRPKGSTVEEMVIEDGVYLKYIMRANSSAKKLLTKAFEDVEKHEEKVQKAREKWEKDQKKKSSKKDDDDKKKDDDKKDDKFVPPAPDDDVKPILDMLAGDLELLVSIPGAAEYLHLLDVIGEREFPWHLRLQFVRESDLFYVIDKDTYGLDVDGIGDKGCFTLCEPTITLHPGTMRQRNLANELAKAGGKVVFVPRSDSVTGHRSWLRDVGEIVAAGMDASEALKAVTQYPAEFMGLGERLGSIDAGRDANILFLDGDPFEPGTEVKAVMLEGEIVHGEVN